MDDPTDNPFLDDLFVDLPTNLPGAARVHQAAFARVLAAVESLLHSGEERSVSPGLGRLFLMTAPEAGYGKSHLVARLRDHLGAVASTLHLPFDRSRPATWPVALSSILRQLSSPSRSRQPGVSMLEESSRFFLSRLVLAGLSEGAVKTRECPVDPGRVKAEFATLFSRDSDSKILAWVDKRAGELARGSDPEGMKRLGLGSGELAFWTRLFIDLNLREDGALDRLRGLSTGEARERLLQLLRITSDHRPAMLVADGLDGFHHSETAGMEIAEIVNGVRERVPCSVTLVCVNDDLWSSIFADRLPSAWRDRLDTEVVRLHAIGAAAAKDLVKFRFRRTRFSEANALRFADRLAELNHWDDAESPLTPRRVLRQAGELWQREASDFLTAPAAVEEEYADIADEPLSNLTDKADFFTELQREEPAVAPRAAVSHNPPPLPPAAPAMPAFAQAAPRPVAPPPLRTPDHDLAGIDSIINDIRGSGKTVTSEAPERNFAPDHIPVTPPAPAPVPVMPSAPAPSHDDAAASMPAPAPAVEVPASATPSFTIPSAPVTGPQRQPIPASFFSGFAPATAPASPSPSMTAPEMAAPRSGSLPLTRAMLEQTLAHRERDLRAGPGLALDLDRIGRFIRTLGAKHPALAQQEERYPSSRTVCLRWTARGHSVLTGFESPRNAYFWNNLLQQSLASNRQEKIAAFSHPSEPFDSSLFSGFGFSPAVIRGRIDVIEMDDRELAMIYAADRTLRDYENTPDAEKAMQFITLHLDPLWRRMIQPL
jgi:hypothetical protein